jgi:tetratricopeptide (TPR) repeat protein
MIMRRQHPAAPVPSHRQSRPANVGSARLRAAVVLRSLAITASLAIAASLAAQPPFADIGAADRALAGDVPAYKALLAGRVEEAASLLRETLAAHPTDALAHQLLCRVAYAQDQAEEAVTQCEQAVANDPAGSDHRLWLGRAYGMKARHAGPFAGFSLARRVQASFARAVELDPNNVAALNDLGEYYVAAPSIVGGGSDKARALAARIMPRFPAAAHRLLARMAVADNDLSTAESEFKQAVAVQKSPEAWIDLAHFYQTHARPDEALLAVRSAVAADRAHDAALVDAASILTAAHRDPQLAERCLRDYLASPATSDAAPVFKVHLQLSKLLAARGDTVDADREIESAAALAPAFTRNARSAQRS